MVRPRFLSFHDMTDPKVLKSRSSSSSLLVFCYLCCDSQQTTIRYSQQNIRDSQQNNKARYNALCVQECPWHVFFFVNFEIERFSNENDAISIAMLSDWLKKLVPIFHPTRSKTQTRTKYRTVAEFHAHCSDCYKMLSLSQTCSSSRNFYCLVTSAM